MIFFVVEIFTLLLLIKTPGYKTMNVSLSLTVTGFSCAVLNSEIYQGMVMALWEALALKSMHT